MSDIEATLLVLRGGAAVLGALFFITAGRAYMRTRSREMLILTIAIALFALGALTEGIALRVLGMGIDQAHVLESLVGLLAFAVLLLSVWLPPRA